MLYVAAALLGIGFWLFGPVAVLKFIGLIFGSLCLLFVAMCFCINPYEEGH